MDMHILYLTDEKNNFQGESTLLKAIKSTFPVDQNTISEGDFNNYFNIVASDTPPHAVFLDFEMNDDVQAAKRTMRELSNNANVGAIFAFNCDQETRDAAQEHSGIIITDPPERQKALEAIQQLNV